MSDKHPIEKNEELDPNTRVEQITTKDGTHKDQVAMVFRSSNKRK